MYYQLKNSINILSIVLYYIYIFKYINKKFINNFNHNCF